MNRFFRFLLLIPLSAAAIFLIYPILHELGHAAATLLLGDAIAGFSLLPVPHVESVIPNDDPGHVAVISLAGMLMPIVLCAPFRRPKGYWGFTILLIRFISLISCAVEFSIALQYSAGEIVAGDDIVLFMSLVSLSPLWAYGYTLALSVWSFISILRMDPLTLIEGLAGPGRRGRSRSGRHIG